MWAGSGRSPFAAGEGLAFAGVGAVAAVDRVGVTVRAVGDAADQSVVATLAGDVVGAVVAADVVRPVVAADGVVGSATEDVLHAGQRRHAVGQLSRPLGQVDVGGFVLVVTRDGE